MARSENTGAGLRALQEAMASGDMALIAATLSELDADSRNALEARLGTEPLKDTFRHARRMARGASRGTVVVLNGIMGAQLDIVSGSTASRIWTNLFRLMRGDFQRLKLAKDGGPFDPAVEVRVAGMFPDYLPLLMQLKERWTVVPFAYDWRQDIARSAAALDSLIRERDLPRPVHLVAHSMGGLVARTFLRRFRETWASLSKGRGDGEVGRLVMLGTPNQGSFAIPLVFTGAERMVRLLGFADLVHGMRKTLDVVGTFPGCYQMLPSPLTGAADDRGKLYAQSAWSGGHVNPDYLKLADAFQRSMAEVLDADRLVYVAGYGETTPYRIRVGGPQQFEYQTTESGDGRVPHELGLLPGVTTYFVRESHGALPKNESVRDSLEELFDTGKTGGLLTSVPRERSMSRDRKHDEWKTADEIEPPSDEEQVAARYRVEVVAKPNEDDDVDHAQATVDEARVMRGWTGAPEERNVEVVRIRRGGAGLGTGHKSIARKARGAVAGAGPGATANRPLLSVQVVWGDITLDEAGDVYVAGHYESVLPQAAEYALDTIVSAKLEPQRKNESAVDFASRRLQAMEGRLVHGLTKRGAIRGSLGDVYFFPWADWALAAESRQAWNKSKRRLVAIAGMGYSGTFSANELRRLARHLVFALQRLPGASTLSSVLIGAGNGNLRVRAAVDAYVRGMLDGLGERDIVGEPVTLRIVEARLGKAVQIERELRRLETESRASGTVAPFQVLPRAVAPRTMDFDEKDAYALALAGAAWRYSSSKSADASDLAPLNEAIQEVLTAAHATEKDADAVRAALKRLWGEVLEQRRIAAGGLAGATPADEANPVNRALEALGTLEIGFDADPSRLDDATTRIGVVRERVGGEFDPTRNTTAPVNSAPPNAAAMRVMTSVSALTKTAVIPKRPSNVDWGLISEAIQRLTDPSPETVTRYGADLASYLLPRDFRDLLSRREPIVFEVDRTTATVPWEMLSNPNDSEQESRPLALARHVARQLRTEYSPPPSLAPVRGRQLRILVVGDPGSPAEGNSLPGARNEALSVVRILEELRDRGAKIDVTAMIGAPSVKDDSRLARFPRASRFDVLSELRRGTYDVLHYCGHGDFDPQEPTRAGWVFEGGLLTSYELEVLDVVPPLVVANACLSGLLSQRTSLGASTIDGGRDQNLVPSLADEFFRRGVHTYIGTAWYVNDVGATEFARAFYQALLDPATVRATGSENSECVDGTVGGAMHYARRTLQHHELEFDALWAAYHHYGDPTQRISLDLVATGEGSSGAAAEGTSPSAATKGAARRGTRTSRGKGRGKRATRTVKSRPKKR